MLRILFTSQPDASELRSFDVPMSTRLRQIPQELWRSYVQFHTRSPHKLQLAGLIGAITFPLYYFVWTYIFPQPFESLALRIAGTILCLILAVRFWWPDKLARWYLLLGYATFLLCLPFYFTLMLLLNGATSIWLISAMSALMFVMLLYDIFNALVVSVAGSLLAIFVFLEIYGGSTIPEPYWATVPVYLFTIVAIALYSYAERPVTFEQLTTARTLASNIAHEIRTPLLGIRMDCERLGSDVGALEVAATWAYEKGWCEGRVLSGRQIRQMHDAVARISEHTRAANLVIEILLANASQERNLASEFAEHSLDEVVASALSRYHFRDGERELINFSIERGLTFWGSDVLLVHVLFNLFKNALAAIGEKKSGCISIRCSSIGDRVRLDFQDTGAGIDADLLPTIFLPFISGSRHMQGSGMGLAFCKRVVESFQGTISCTSTKGEGSTFTIMLPITRPKGKGNQAAT